MEKLTYERPLIQKLNTGLLNKFGTSSELIPITHLDGVAVKRLLNDFGSPLFVLSEKTIRQKYKEANRTFKMRYPKVQFSWSYKTNYLNAVCNIFHQEGSWAEVVSGFEHEKALLNGVPGNKIIFNGPGKLRHELIKAVECETLIHIDHLDELYTIMNIAETSAKKPQVAIRVNMDTGIYPKWDRFGFNYENGQAWDALNKILMHEKLSLAGLHCHIGTFMLSTNAYRQAAHKLVELALRIKQKYGKMVGYIDLGGGFPSTNNLKGTYLPGNDMVPPLEDFAEAITSEILNSDITPNELPTLILESGRALVDEAGFLLGTVIANKRLSDGRRATILDFGLNLLFTSIWYNHKIVPAQNGSHYKEDIVLYGPLCMNIDVVRESISLPPLNPGDQVVVQNVGAYNMTQWMQFISMRPNVVLIDTQGQPHLIREHEDVHTINRLEKVPGHLQKFDL